MAFASFMVLSGAFVLVLLGATVAWAAQNATKRVAGVMVAHIGAILALAALSAPAGLALATVAIGLAHCAIGIAIVVRLQEAYGTIEARDVDVDDDNAEAPEPGA